MIPGALVCLVSRDVRFGMAISVGGERRGWGGGACSRGLAHGRLLPGVCCCCVFRGASVSVARPGLSVACRDLLVNCFLSDFGLSDTAEVDCRNVSLSHSIMCSYVVL